MGSEHFVRSGLEFVGERPKFPMQPGPRQKHYQKANLVHYIIEIMHFFVS